MSSIVKTESTLTYANAQEAFAAGARLIDAGAQYVDCQALKHFDSAALAVLIGWKRKALALGQHLELRNLSDKLVSLVRVYGLDQILEGSRDEID